MWKGANGVYNRFIKRLLDIICAVLAMTVFCWLYVIIAILVRVNLGSPVLFKQQRPGKIDKRTGKEKVFNLYKFRSMSNAKNDKGELLSDAQRLTKFGKFLRATSLDELPEAWNILRGDTWRVYMAFGKLKKIFNNNGIRLFLIPFINIKLSSQ